MSAALGGAIEIVAIGTSTGGPNALAEVMPSFPKDFPVPIVVVQHMPPVFHENAGGPSVVAEPITYFGGEEGSGAGEPGHAWIAPGNFHMTVGRGENA